MDKRTHLLIGKLRGQGSLLKRATWPDKRDLPGLVGDMPRIVPPHRANNGNKAITGSGAVEWLTSQSLGECTVRARGGRLPRAQYIESGAAREHYKYVASIHYEGNHKNPTKRTLCKRAAQQSPGALNCHLHIHSSGTYSHTGGGIPANPRRPVT